MTKHLYMEKSSVKLLAYLLSLSMLMLVSGVIGQVINPDSSYVSFQIQKGSSDTVPGTIRGMEGRIRFDPENLSAARFEVCVDPATIETGIGMRDRHLRGGQFFDAKDFPSICFSSKHVDRHQDGYLLKGNLTLLEATREVEIPFTFKEGVFKGSFSLNRLDYGLGFKRTGMVGDPVEIGIYCVTYPETLRR